MAVFSISADDEIDSNKAFILLGMSGALKPKINTITKEMIEKHLRRKLNKIENENNKLRRCLLDLRQKEKLEDYEFSTSDREEVRKIETKLKMLSVHGHELRLAAAFLKAKLRIHELTLDHSWRAGSAIHMEMVNN